MAPLESKPLPPGVQRQQQPNTTNAVAGRGILAVVSCLISLVVSSACIGILLLLGGLLKNHRAEKVEVDATAAWIIDHPYMVILLCIPAVGAAIYGSLFTVARVLKLRSILSLVALGMILPLLVVTYCFIQMMSPHYQYQPL